MAKSKATGLARFRRQPNASPGTSPTAPTNALRQSADDVPQREETTERPKQPPKSKLVGVYLMPDGHTQLKVEAAKRGVSISDLVRDAVNAWFVNERLPPLA